MKIRDVKINENGRIAFTFTGVEIPSGIRYGRMKPSYDVIYLAAAPVQATARTITFHDGNNKVLHGSPIIILEKGKDKWIDVSVDEKRAREDGNHLPCNVQW